MHTEYLWNTVIAWKKNQLLIQRPIINTYNNKNSNAVKHMRQSNVHFWKQKAAVCTQAG